MDSLVVCEGARLAECLSAGWTFERLITGVCPFVMLKATGRRVRSIAPLPDTIVVLFSRMNSTVALETARRGKALSASFPVTFEGLLLFSKVIRRPGCSRNHEIQH